MKFEYFCSVCGKNVVVDQKSDLCFCPNCKLKPTSKTLSQQQVEYMKYHAQQFMKHQKEAQLDDYFESRINLKYVSAMAHNAWAIVNEINSWSEE